MTKKGNELQIGWIELLSSLYISQNVGWASFFLPTLSPKLKLWTPKTGKNSFYLFYPCLYAILVVVTFLR